MDFFKRYTSNTLAGSGNQYYFRRDDPEKITICRICYKVFSPGEYRYSFLFSNTIDSTFSDGAVSHRNMVIDSWKIHAMRAGITRYCDEHSMQEPDFLAPLTFDGNTEKAVHPGEFFDTDGITLAPGAGEYICLEIAFSGGMIPCHEENIIPSFVLENGAWTPSKRHPFASMVGCDRPVKGRIAFFGDSITQGIGTRFNSYAHWNSVAAESTDTNYAYWNLGLGFGRAADAASDGAWLFKAKQNDIVVVCFGVNDIFHEQDGKNLEKNLNTIVDTLNGCGKRVILQTIPPFDYEGESIGIWQRANEYIRNELSKKVEFVFDCAALLAANNEEPYKARYGGHPNAEGCKIWGEALSGALREYLKRIA